MATAETGYLPNICHPDVMRSILEQILATGDIIGSDRPGSHGRRPAGRRARGLGG